MTIDMREAAERLRVLHDHDQKIRHLERDIHDGPARLGGLQGTVAEIDKKIKAVEERALILRAQIKLRENELKATEQKIERIRAQSSEVKTNKEFVAFRAELSNYQADADRLQGEVLKILDVVEQAAAKVESLKADRQRAIDKVDASRAKLEESLEDVKKERDELLEARKALLADVPAEALAVYERVHKIRGNAVAWLEGEYCGSCMERLTRNDQIAVQNSSRFILCRGCNRILMPMP